MTIFTEMLRRHNANQPRYSLRSIKNIATAKRAQSVSYTQSSTRSVSRTASKTSSIDLNSTTRTQRPLSIALGHSSSSSRPSTQTRARSINADATDPMAAASTTALPGSVVQERIDTNNRGQATATNTRIPNYDDDRDPNRPGNPIAVKTRDTPPSPPVPTNPNTSTKPNTRASPANEPSTNNPQPQQPAATQSQFDLKQPAGIPAPKGQAMKVIAKKADGSSNLNQTPTARLGTSPGSSSFKVNKPSPNAQKHSSMAKTIVEASPFKTFVPGFQPQSSVSAAAKNNLAASQSTLGSAIIPSDYEHIFHAPSQLTHEKETSTGLHKPKRRPHRHHHHHHNNLSRTGHRKGK